jgi:two-component system response regulator TctD
MRILLVEDNLEWVSLLVDWLERNGFCVDSVGDTTHATHAVGATRYAGIILDIDLPREGGLSWLRTLRSHGIAIPVLVLTARGCVSDRVTGLQAGADDYLVKPFAMEELRARLGALLRRSANLLSHRLALGNVVLDTETRQVFVDGSARHFPAREMAVLELLLRRSGRVVLSRSIEDQLFGYKDAGGPNAVQVYIHRLRHVLVQQGASVEIHTAHGLGYVLREK